MHFQPCHLSFNTIFDKTNKVVQVLDPRWVGRSIKVQKNCTGKDLYPVKERYPRFNILWFRKCFNEKILRNWTFFFLQPLWNAKAQFLSNFSSKNLLNYKILNLRYPSFMGYRSFPVQIFCTFIDLSTHRETCHVSSFLHPLSPHFVLNSIYQKPR